MIEMEEMTKYLERGLFRPYVLWKCSKSQISGMDLLDAEKVHQHVLSPGKLYPVLHKLMSDGLLTEEPRIEHGRIHKYYRTTSKGVKALEKLRIDLGPPMKDFLVEWLRDSIEARTA